MHLGKEALDLFGLAAASPEVDVIPHLVPEKRTGFHQRLHNVKLFTWVFSIVMVESVADMGNDDEITLPFRVLRRAKLLGDTLVVAQIVLHS